jgi:hypothetical protein
MIVMFNVLMRRGYIGFGKGGQFNNLNGKEADGSEGLLVH